MKLVCTKCNITRDKTDTDVVRTGRIYHCAAGHAMLKVRSPVGWAIVYAINSVVLALVIRLFCALAVDVNIHLGAALPPAMLGVLVIWSGSKKLGSPISVLGKKELGMGIGSLAGAAVMSILHLLNLPGPLE
jgi:hypothetical protein